MVKGWILVAPALLPVMKTKLRFCRIGLLAMMKTGPLGARFSRGWVEIVADFSNLASIGVGFKDVPLRSFAPFVVNDFAFSEIWDRFEHTSARNELGLIQTA
jgi:hypothetical protein